MVTQHTDRSQQSLDEIVTGRWLDVGVRETLCGSRGRELMQFIAVLFFCTPSRASEKSISIMIVASRLTL